MINVFSYSCCAEISTNALEVLNAFLNDSVVGLDVSYKIIDSPYILLKLMQNQTSYLIQICVEHLNGRQLQLLLKQWTLSQYSLCKSILVLLLTLSTDTRAVEILRRAGVLNLLAQIKHVTQWISGQVICYFKFRG